MGKASEPLGDDKMMSNTQRDVKKKIPNLNLFDPESHRMLQAKLLIFGLDNKHNLMD